MFLKDRCRDCFEVLAVPARFKIFTNLLRRTDRFVVSDLVKLTHLRQSTVSFHLDRLEKAGLVKREKAGKLVYCNINRKCPGCPLFD